MGNPYAGEVTVAVNGEPKVCKLTLGALAELEAELGAGSLSELVDRFETGTFQANDVLALLFAGLRGGGWTGSKAELVTADLGAGPMDAARLAAKVLVLAFSLPNETAA